MRKLKEIASWLWQCPQHLLALCLRAYYKGEDTAGKALVDTKITEELASDTLVRTSEKMKGGISLGKYIIIEDTATRTTIAHEMGHSKQSKILGPLYLIAVGIPSALRASVFSGKNCEGKDNWFYYGRYPENWADKIAGITRDYYNKR